MEPQNSKLEKFAAKKFTNYDDIFSKVGEKSPKIAQDENENRQPQEVSLRQLWRETLMEASLHGCKQMVQQRYWSFTRYIWIIFVLGMAASLGFVLVNLFIVYREYPFKTVWSLRHQKDVPLPAITFCLPTYVNMEKMKAIPWLYEYLNKTRSQVPLNEHFKNEKQMNEYMDKVKVLLNNITWTEISEIAGIKREEVIFHYTKGWGIIQESELSEWFQPAPDSYKACWVMNQNRSGGVRSMSNTDRIVLMFDAIPASFTTDIRHVALEMYVHESHTSHSALSVDPIYLRPGSLYAIQFTRIEHRYLPHPYNSLGDSSCLNTEDKDFINPFKLLGEKYSKQHCVLENMMKNLSVECNCTSSNTKMLFPNVSECSMMQLDYCYTTKSLYFRWQAEVNVNFAKSLGCLPECTSATYDVTISSANFPNENALLDIQNHFEEHISFDHAHQHFILFLLKNKSQKVHVVEHVPELTILSIFGTVGGYMGLFLGASLLTLTEFFEALVISLLLVTSRFSRVLFRRN